MRSRSGGGIEGGEIGAAGAGNVLSALACGLLILAAGCASRNASSNTPPDTSLQANAVLTCEQIGGERSAIAASLQSLTGRDPSDPEIKRLNRLQAGLTDLAANKGCKQSATAPDL
jgi:hypothetical protein